MSLSPCSDAGPDVPRYLLFQVDGEYCAFDIRHIREVCEVAPVTPVPGISESYLGLMNIRGNVISILDLRIVCGLPSEVPVHGKNIVILAEYETRGSRVPTGFIVDGISGVFDAETEKTPDTTERSDRIPGRFIRQYSVIGGVTAAVLDVQALVTEPADGEENSPSFPAVER